MTDIDSRQAFDDQRAELACMNAVINFTLEGGLDRLDFLYLWREGEFARCLAGWPKAPELCYRAADPLARG